MNLATTSRRLEHPSNPEILETPEFREMCFWKKRARQTTYLGAKHRFLFQVWLEYFVNASAALLRSSLVVMHGTFRSCRVAMPAAMETLSVAH